MNNSCSTDFYNECMRDDYPHKVIWHYYQTTVREFDFYRTPQVTEEEDFDRFDILDIPLLEIESEGLTMEKIQKRFDKIREEINSNSTWKDTEPKRIASSLLEEDLRKMLEDDFKKCLEKSIIKSIIKIKEKTQINDRFEILDL